MPPSVLCPLDPREASEHKNCKIEEGSREEEEEEGKGEITYENILCRNVPCCFIFQYLCFKIRREAEVTCTFPLGHHQSCGIQALKGEESLLKLTGTHS